MVLALLSSCSSKREARRGCSFGSLRTPSYSSSDHAGTGASSAYCLAPLDNNVRLTPAAQS